ncbi:MarR family winged helix-turn-helix transcriptional regulator [Nioella ostreopsis]|jgi:DNA-binding MarR family transcriptional regulator|uniref:MarR family winged helix-turn-helix transcriptional regulator n=1 Tax=Nioella ostreopsis TaxID=2448479 RepID=UPI000FDBE1E1|nr:MarR family transcriptional regulator [Nioella ostreopsis]
MDGQRLKYGLHDSIGFHASYAARLVERRVEEGLRRFALTRVGWCILLAVAEEGLKNPSDIAAFVGIDRTATSRALRALETEGLITRAIGKEDRRMTEVSMTDAGYDRMIQAVPICSENMNHFNAKLTVAERSELKRLLAKLCAGEGGSD